MTDAFAMMAGYIFGWFSVVAAHRMLQQRDSKPKAEVKPEAAEVYQQSEDKVEQQWLEQLNSMLNYDAKGGGKDGNKD